MFNWQVDRMNLTILPDGEGTEAFKNKTKTIGLLDIFGFECFPENKFE
jgi:myosin heavy subunit